jgi:hypothetical protein
MEGAQDIVEGLGRHPQAARFARTCFQQAKAAMLSASKIKHLDRSALTTFYYYYCVSHRSYAVKGFAFGSPSRYSNKFSQLIRLRRTVRSENFFSHARPTGDSLR